MRTHIGLVPYLHHGIDRSEMSFSMNGDFSHPMGVAFRDVVFVGGIMPALTANNKSKFRFNFGQKRSVCVSIRGAWPRVRTFI